MFFYHLEFYLFSPHSGISLSKSFLEFMTIPSLTDNFDFQEFGTKLGIDEIGG